MADDIDLRIVIVGVEVDGRLQEYKDLMLSITGTKFANANQNEAEIKIANLSKATADYILTQTSPFTKNKTPKRVIVKAGRDSFGTFQVYTGNIVSSVISSPPDTTITLKCLTGNFAKGNIVAHGQGANASLKTVSQQVAKDLGVSLNYQAKDKTLYNYNYTGGALNQVDELGQSGQIDAYVDDDTLVVKDVNLPLPNTLRVLDQADGMVSIPEFTEQGVKVKFFLDKDTKLGGGLRINSKIYPAVNGDYVIYKLGFEIANRDTPFYWDAECKRL